MPLPLKTLAAALALIALTVPRAAFAQGSYGETIRGTIVSLDGAGNVELRDDRGFVDNVRLEPNVEVTPAGVQLVPGMRVTISGANAGSVFAAERVAAADASPPQAAPPTYAYPESAYGYAYPYPVYVYPYPVYAYPYPIGPRFSIGIGFGFGANGFRGHYRH